MTLIQAQLEGSKLLFYYRGILVPEEKAMYLASDFVMRLFLSRQDELLDQISLKKKQKGDHNGKWT